MLTVVGRKGSPLPLRPIDERPFQPRDAAQKVLCASEISVKGEPKQVKN